MNDGKQKSLTLTLTLTPWTLGFEFFLGTPSGTLTFFFVVPSV